MADMHHLLGIDLEAQLWTMPWRRFAMLVRVLLTYPDSLLGMSIDQDKQQPTDEQPAEPADADSEQELIA